MTFWQQIAKEARYFQRFEGRWPIYALLKQYLGNLQDKYKKTIRTEREAEADDTDDWSAAAQGGDEEEEAAGSENDNTAANDDHIDYSEDEGLGIMMDDDDTNTGDPENDFYANDGGIEDGPEFDFERGTLGEREEQHHSEPKDTPPPKKNKVGCICSAIYHIVLNSRIISQEGCREIFTGSQSDINEIYALTASHRRRDRNPNQCIGTQVKLSQNLIR